MGTIKQFDLIEIREKSNIDIFVETGTFHGHGTDYALDSGFNQVYTIEINSQLADAATKKYANDTRVTVIQGDSSVIMPQLASKIDKPAVFWLDAHFPGADAGLSGYNDTKDYNTRVPLEAELHVISKRKQRDIIICDDLWIYEDGPFECGTFNDHAARHGHGITRQEICGRTLEEVYSAFKDSHNVKKIYNHQGYLVLLPK